MSHEDSQKVRGKNLFARLVFLGVTEVTGVTTLIYKEKAVTSWGSNGVTRGNKSVKTWCIFVKNAKNHQINSEYREKRLPKESPHYSLLARLLPLLPALPWVWIDRKKGMRATRWILFARHGETLRLDELKADRGTV